MDTCDGTNLGGWQQCSGRINGILRESGLASGNVPAPGAICYCRYSGRVHCCCRRGAMGCDGDGPWGVDGRSDGIHGCGYGNVWDWELFCGARNILMFVELHQDCRSVWHVKSSRVAKVQNAAVPRMYIHVAVKHVEFSPSSAASSSIICTQRHLSRH